MSCAKDKTLKVWDVGAQVCHHTAVERAELNCLLAYSVDAAELPGASSSSASPSLRVLAGGADHLLRVYAVEYDATGRPCALKDLGALQRGVENNSALNALELCTVRRAEGVLGATERVVFGASNGKTLEFFRLHDADEVSKKIKRRKRRSKEKAAAKGNTNTNKHEAGEEEG